MHLRRLHQRNRHAWIALLAGLLLVFASREGDTHEPLKKTGDSSGTKVTSVSHFPKPDEKALRAKGIRRLDGEHITIYTDLPKSPSVEELPAVFDLGLPQWCAYFGVDAAKTANWKVTAYLMKDKARFDALKLIPENLPPFKNGYALGSRIWVHDQTSDYYRRHLLLHEGTHSFMFEMLGSCGPAWYMEGLAELLGTHRWDKDKRQLTLGYYPKDRKEVPGLGRVRMIHDEVAAQRARTMKSILKFSHSDFLKNKPYSWCWAMAAFLDGHPRYRDRFQAMTKYVKKADFNQRFLQAMKPDWRELNEEWLLFVAQIEHGFDLERSAIRFAEGEPIGSTKATARVSAERGWQSSGVTLEAGVTYRIQASGRYQIAQKPKTWWCEPGGITIRYHQGQPLGILLGAVRGETSQSLTPLFHPKTIGLKTTWTPKRSGTLYLRINDSAAELADNRGELLVEIEPIERRGN